MNAKIVGGRLSRFWLLGFFGVAIANFVGITGHVSAAPDWQTSLSKETPGSFPPLRPLHASYVFGWSGFTAATAEVQFSRSSSDRCQLQGSGRTVGLARALWRYDVTYAAIANASTLRPIDANQTDAYRSKKITTHLAFNPTGVRRARSETPAPASGQSKPKDFDFPNLFDLQTAMLYLRSQPLPDRSSYRVVVYPATNAYLATATVIGHERTSVRGGSYNAIKLDIQLKKIGKALDLQPHRKFRRAAVWVSDDADRLLLRAEAQIFIGTVFAELRSVHFDAPRSRADESPGVTDQFMGGSTRREPEVPAESPDGGE